MGKPRGFKWIKMSSIVASGAHGFVGSPSVWVFSSGLERSCWRWDYRLQEQGLGKFNVSARLDLAWLVARFPPAKSTIKSLETCFRANPIFFPLIKRKMYPFCLKEIRQFRITRPSAREWPKCTGTVDQGYLPASKTTRCGQHMRN